MKAEETTRKNASRDLRFLTGDQWPDGEVDARRKVNRPALVINKLPPFVKQITNDQRKQKPGIKVSPVGGGADAATAEIFEGIIRHVEYESQADVAYDTGFDYAVSSSFGYWRYVTVYADDRSTDQDIRVARITDPQSVILDCDAQEPDRSDAMWAFVLTRMSKAEFKRRYKESEAATTDFEPPGGWLAPNWLSGDDVVVAEAWQVELEEKKLLMWRGRPAPDPDDDADDYSTDRPQAIAGPGTGNIPYLNGAPPPLTPAPPAAGLAGQPSPNGGPGALARIAAAADADEQGMVVRGFYEDEEVPEGFEPLLADPDDDDSEQLGRTVEIRHVFRYDTNGHEILGKPKPWAGKYIPIVPVYGEEKVVEGKVILESSIRHALDPQQLYNFYKTGEAEVVQQTPKNPYIGVLGQFKTMQMYWADANRTPRATLEYDPVTVAGQLAPPPQRQAYEPATQALTIGAAAANEDIKATTGLFDPSRGAATPNADSGFAIDLLQQQGATATYHFFDNFMRSMWFGYRILVDLIPRIYDTPRVIRIVRPDDVAEMVQIGRMFTGKDGKRLRYDLAQGTYAVVLSVQPSYATRKMRAAAELTQLAKADPQQLPQWADLFVRQLDIGPLGDEIAERLTPPQYQKNQPNPQMVQQQAAQLAQQNQMLQQQITELSNVLATKSYETQAKNEQNARDNETKLAIAAMQEETKRMSQATSMAIAEIETKVQTVGRTMADVLATLREREAMAHQIALAAHTRALAIHDASELPPGMPGAQQPQNGPQNGPPDPNAQQIPPGAMAPPAEQPGAPGA
jgi:Phage P22-like portal protein